MVLNAPFIHLFKIAGSFYFYDVNRNSILKVQKSLWELLKKQQHQSNQEVQWQDNENNSIVEKMREQGFLSSNRVKEILHPADEILVYHLDNKIQMLTLQVTQQCNLRCNYCVYSGDYHNRQHSNNKMSFETAKKAIDFLISHSNDNRYISLGFYGGEPLIEFDLIKRCIEYAKVRGLGKELMFSITTNGTLMDDEIIEYLENNNVSLMISLDGPKEIQDKNRKFAFNNCGTFDKVMENVKRVKNKFPEYYKKIAFSAVIDPKNDFSCINTFFSTDEIIGDHTVMSSVVSDNYSKSEEKYNEDFSIKYNYEYFKILLCELNRLDRKYISKFVDRRFSDLKRTYRQLTPSDKVPEKTQHSGPCIPGAQRLFITTEGKFYPCEKVSEMSEVIRIGDLEKGFNIDKVRAMLNIGKITEDKCKNCWAFRFCKLCAVFSDEMTQLSSDKKTSYCDSIKQDAESMLKDICMLKDMNYDFSGISNTKYNVFNL